MNLRFGHLAKVVVASACFLAGPAFGDWEEITDEIKTRIKRLEPPIGAHTVDIEYTNNGSVILAGTVDSAADRRRVEAATLGTEGVSKVENRLEVSSPVKVADVPERSPSADRVLAAVHRDVTNKGYRLQVHPLGDGIQLSGTVDNEQTREQIVQAARRAYAGEVQDRLVLRPPPPDSAVEELVSNTIAKQFPAIAPKLSVDVEEGTVRLAGDLSDHWDIDKVLASVVMLDGVRNVDSGITINGAPYHSSGAIPEKK